MDSLAFTAKLPVLNILLILSNALFSRVEKYKCQSCNYFKNMSHIS